MAVAEQAELVVALKLKDQTSGPVAKLQGNLNRLNENTKQLQQGLGKIGQGLRLGLQRAAVGAAAAAGFLALQIRSGINSLVELERTTDQTRRIISALGKQTNVTAKQVRALSTELEDQTAVDDKLIQKGINLGLQFGKLRKNQLKPFAKTALDISEATGKDALGAFQALGAALGDPERRLAALDRTTKAFSKSQIEQIQNLAKQGRLSEAQARILGILNSKFGGASLRGQDSYRKNVARLNDAIEELQMSLARPLIRPLSKLAETLAAFASTQEVKDGLRDLGEGIASLFTDENLTKGVEAIQSGFTFLKDLPWDTIRQGAATTATIAGAALRMFQGLPKEVQTGLITILAANKLTGGLVASGLGDIATFLLRNLTTIKAAVVNVIGAKVNTGIGPDVNLPDGGGKNKGLLSWLDPRNIIAALATSLGVSAGTAAVTAAGAAVGSIALALGATGALYGGPNRPLRPGDPGYGPGFAGAGRMGFDTGRRGPRSNPPESEGPQAGFAPTPMQIVEAAIQRFQQSPGRGPEVRTYNDVLMKLERLAAISDEGNEKANDINAKLGMGVITYRQANRTLDSLLAEQQNVKRLIAGQKTTVNVTNQTTISAVAAQRSLTIVANSHRAIIE